MRGNLSLSVVGEVNFLILIIKSEVVFIRCGV